MLYRAVPFGASKWTGERPQLAVAPAYRTIRSNRFSGGTSMQTASGEPYSCERLLVSLYRKDVASLEQFCLVAGQICGASMVGRWHGTGRHQSNVSLIFGRSNARQPPERPREIGGVVEAGGKRGLRDRHVRFGKKIPRHGNPVLQNEVREGTPLFTRERPTEFGRAEMAKIRERVTREIPGEMSRDMGDSQTRLARHRGCTS